MTKLEKAEFLFRVWVPPEDSDPVDVEAWFQGLEQTGSGTRFVTDWVKEVLQDEDHHTLFNLDKSKHWQVVGKGVIRGWYSPLDEYDERIDILEFEKAEVQNHCDTGNGATFTIK